MAGAASRCDCVESESGECHLGWRRATEKKGVSAGAERSGRLITGIYSANGERKNKEAVGSGTCVCLVWVVFSGVDVLQTPLNSHCGNLLRFICYDTSFCVYASW